MAARCRRCDANDLELESYGVFRCPACGRVDIEGNPIADGETQPAAAIRTGTATFAPPPLALSIPEPATPRLPRLLFVMIIAQAILTILGAMLLGGSLVRVVVRFTVFGGLLIGHRRAYVYACAAHVMSMGLGVMRFLAVAAYIPPPLRWIVVLLGAIDVGFLVALLRPETRKHYMS